MRLFKIDKKCVISSDCYKADTNLMDYAASTDRTFSLPPLSQTESSLRGDAYSGRHDIARPENHSKCALASSLNSLNPVPNYAILSHIWVDFPVHLPPFFIWQAQTGPWSADFESEDEREQDGILSDRNDHRANNGSVLARSGRAILPLPGIPQVQHCG